MLASFLPVGFAVSVLMHTILGRGPHPDFFSCGSTISLLILSPSWVIKCLQHNQQVAQEARGTVGRLLQHCSSVAAETLDPSDAIVDISFEVAKPQSPAKQPVFQCQSPQWLDPGTEVCHIYMYKLPMEHTLVYTLFGIDPSPSPNQTLDPLDATLKLF